MQPLGTPNIPDSPPRTVHSFKRDVEKFCRDYEEWAHLGILVKSSRLIILLVDLVDIFFGDITQCQTDPTWIFGQFSMQLMWNQLTARSTSLKWFRGQFHLNWGTFSLKPDGNWTGCLQNILAERQVLRRGPMVKGIRPRQAQRAGFKNLGFTEPFNVNPGLINPQAV